MTYTLPNEDQFIEEVFGAFGQLAARPGYVYREGQKGMAREVFRALEHPRGYLLAEAGTGVGKSYAYLAPAIEAARGGKKIVIATANINLQHQLVEKDLPTLQELMGWGGTFALCKGVQNYFCDHEYETAVESGVFDSLPPDLAQQVLDIQRHWAEIGKGPKPQRLTTLKEVYDRSNLPFEPSPELWSKMSIDSEGCLGSECNHFKWCSANIARTAAYKADIVVANYHILFADLVSQGSILGFRHALICDEAHELAEIGRDFFGAVFSGNVIRRVVKRLYHDGLKKKVIDTTKTFFKKLQAAYYGDLSEGKVRLSDPLAVDAMPVLDALVELRDHYGDIAESAFHSKEATSQARRDAEYARDVHTRLFDLAQPQVSPEHVYYLSLENKRLAIEMKPVSIADMLSRTLWSGVGRMPSTVVLTSATLSDGKSFSLIREECGVPDTAVEYVAPTPFDLTRQCAVFIDSTMPVPSGETRGLHMRFCVDRFQKIIEEARGRTLGLFTSRASMIYVYSELLKRWEDSPPFPIYVQGTMSKREILARFKEETNSVLFGLSSFWAGVDVPGESLSCVVIDKLPFPSPDDPVIQALTERRGGGWRGFSEVSVPRAVIDLRQGYGRLIRAVDDFGVLVILDPRLAQARYRARFTQGLVGVPYLLNLDRFKEAVDYFDRERVIARGLNRLAPRVSAPITHE
jgi:ATP-dependent DNA helicase DinG